MEDYSADGSGWLFWVVLCYSAYVEPMEWPLLRDLGRLMAFCSEEVLHYSGGEGAAPYLSGAVGDCYYYSELAFGC